MGAPALFLFWRPYEWGIRVGTRNGASVALYHFLPSSKF